MNKYLRLAVILAMLFMVAGCLTEKNMAQVRADYARRNPGKITLGIIGPLSLIKDDTGFLNGVNLAVKEITAHNKALDLKLRLEDDQANFMVGMRIAQDLAARPEITAVIGPWNSSIALPVARIYNDAGLVMLSPVVSNPELTQKGYSYVFRNTLSDTAMGRQMAQYAIKLNYRRVVINYVDNEYGMALANAFEDVFSQSGRKVIDRVTDFNNALEFDHALEKWQALNYDAVFVADSMPHASDFIRQMRAKESNIPMFGGDGLDVVNFSVKLGAAAEGFVVATMFNPEQKRAELRQFMARYRKKYGEAPDVWAVQGYDSVKLLAYAIKKAGSASPPKIVATLHALKGWPGILGQYGFDQTGEMKGIGIYKKTFRNGKFEYIK